MTALDPVTEAERPRAFFARATWKRVVVLSAGSAMHFLIGVVLLYGLAVTSGLPSTDTSAKAGTTACVPATQDPRTLAPSPCSPTDPGPAARAGIRPGDTILQVAGIPTPTWPDAVTAIRGQRGPTPFLIERDGRTFPVVVDVATVRRAAVSATPGADNKLVEAGAIGLGQQILAPVVHDPISAIPATFGYTGWMFGATWQGLLSFPEKVPAVWGAIAGGPPDLNRPVSVVGASVIGGDAIRQGSWATFFLLLAALNFFVGVFNLVPLLPLDGGHIAVNLYERVRDSVRRRLGRPSMPPVDYTRLLPLTYAFVVVLGVISVMTIVADIVNPIRL